MLSKQDVTELQSTVFKYDPKDAGLPIPTINLLLCGGVGAGKSSIVSTVIAFARAAPPGEPHMVRAQAP